MSPARTLLFVFRWGIFLLACIHIYTQLTSAKGNQSLHALWALLKAPQLLFITSVVFILMLVNWAIESVKWRKLLEPFAPIGNMRAFKATIAGTSLALISPNRTGEFVGRVMFLPPGQRYRGAVATMLGGVAQFLVTLIAGVIALILMTQLGGHRYGLDGDMVILALTVLTMIVIVLVLLLYFHPSLLVRILYRWPMLRRWHSDLAILEHYSMARLTSIFVISCFRYVVFTGQFVLLLSIFEGGPSLLDATLAVPVIFLVATLIPTVLLTELGVRGSVALAILGPTGAAEGTVLLATFAIWMINLMVPAIAGSFILITARIRTGGERR